MRESDRKWALFEMAVYSTASVMRGDDVGSKMGATHHLYGLIEEVEKALQCEDEEP